MLITSQIETKVCSKCKQKLPVTKFSTRGEISKLGFIQYKSMCNDCRKAHEKIHRPSLAKEMLARAKFRAKTKSFEFNLTISDIEILSIKQQGKCALSGIPLNWEQFGDKPFDRASLDRIDSSKGYTKDNIQLLAFCVNAGKLDMPINKYVSICKQIVSFSKLE